MTSPRFRLAQWLVRLLEGVVILIMAALCLDVLWGVFSRFVLNNQSSWTEELAGVLLIWVSLLGAALAFAEKAHLGVDYLAGKLAPSARRLMAALSHVVVGFFAGSVLVYGGGQLVRKTLDMGQTVMSLGIPKGWVYLALPVSGCFVLLFALEGLWETLVGARETGDYGEGGDACPD